MASIDVSVINIKCPNTRKLNCLKKTPTVGQRRLEAAVFNGKVS